MKLKFSWLNSRKSLFFSSFVDFAFISYFLLFFQNSISSLSIFTILNLSNSFIWIISSYIFGRYENIQLKKLNIFSYQFLKTSLNISINLLITQVIFRFFWNWDYMNFDSFSDFLKDFLDFYKTIFIFSGLSQYFISLFLSNKFSNKSIWLFLGNLDREKYFKNLIGSKTNVQIKQLDNIDESKVQLNAKGIVIDDEEMFKKKIFNFFSKFIKKVLKL